MKYVTKVQTHDGKIHDDKRAALKHLDNEFGKIILPVSKKLAELRYMDFSIMEYIEANLGEFEKLIKIKQDMEIIKEED